MSVESTIGITRWPTYSMYKNADIDWIDEIPAHWTFIRNSAIFSERSEKGFAELPALSVSLRKGVTLQEYTDDQIDRGAEDKSGYKRTLAGELVYNKMRMWQGAVGVAPVDGIVSPAYIVCTPRREIDPRYFEYFYRSPLGIMLSGRYSYGICKDMNSLRYEDFKCMEVICPPIEEQRAITVFLDRETARVDAIISQKEELIRLLQEKQQALITRVVLRGITPNVQMKDSGVPWIGNVPAHWRVMRLAMAADSISNGYVGPTRDILIDEGVRYLQSLHIKQGQIRFSKPYYVSEEWSNAHARSILREGDLLIVQTGDIGQCCAVPKEFEGCNCHALIIVRMKPELALGDYISALLRSHYGIHILRKLQTGALLPHLECGHIREIPVVLPPTDEQSILLEYISAKTFEYNECINKANEQLNLLNEYRTSLITAAVTGKIDVTEVRQ